MNNMHENLHSLLELSGHAGFPDASEMHGLLCAHACVAAEADHKAGARELLRWLGADAQQQDLLQACCTALQMTTSSLLDTAGDFRPLLPHDSDSLQQRTEALAAWAGGFVSGMGVHVDASLNAEAAEALADLQNISRASLYDAEDGTQPPDEESLEQAYSELVEYVRVAAQLIHHALLLQQKTTPSASAKLH